MQSDHFTASATVNRQKQPFLKYLPRPHAASAGGPKTGGGARRCVIAECKTAG